MQDFVSLSVPKHSPNRKVKPMAPSSVSFTDSTVKSASNTESLRARRVEGRDTEETSNVQTPSGIEDKVNIGTSSEGEEYTTYSPQSLSRGNTETQKPDQPELFPEEDEEADATETDETEREKQTSAETKKKDELTQDEQTEVAKLKARDTEVKAHEQAHIAAGGQYVRGGASFEYKTGPDGEKYAVGGEVSIDVSKVSDNPEATITKMQVVIRSAMAPANPSAQDRSVASSATRIANEARAEMMSNNPANVSAGKSEKEGVETDKNASDESEPGKSLKIDRYV